jgi:N-acetylglucosamine kinase-like BadF-type ATPase
VSQALPAALAIDGGNSKTDVALVARDGTLLALVRGPGMPARLGADTVRVIDELIRLAVKLAREDHGAGSHQADMSLLERFGYAAGQAESGHVASHLVACVANADLPSERRELEQMLRGEGWTATTTAVNDTYAVLRAGLDDVPAAGADRYWGVGMTCGTGINCVGIAPDGTTAGFLALGMITGDWGGGSGIGMEALWNAVRASDGRGPRTMLMHAVPGYFGMKEPLEVAEAMHRGEISWDQVADLAPVMLRAADAGDDVARGLVLRLGEEFFLMVKSVITRLGLGAEPVPVVLGGGVVASGNALLIDRATGMIRAEFPNADVRVLKQVPVAGAALMGLDLAEAPTAAKRRLRAAFASRQAAQS